MHKINNFVFVTNVQHGACLLFDRKGLGCCQSRALRTNRLVKSSLQLVQALQRRITENIK
jgi:hypothetical protein